MKVLIAQGKEVFVDDDVYQWAKHFDWKISNRGYVCISQHRSNVWLHRAIMDTPKGMLCDHIDRNPLNNQRSNLRNCTKTQNICNRSMQKRPNKHGYRGVVKDKRRAGKPYRVALQWKGNRYHGGVYSTIEEAARAYDRLAKEIHGEFAVLNFPEETNVNN